MFKEVKAFVLGQLDVGYLQRLGKRGSVASQVTELKEKLNFAINIFQVGPNASPVLNCTSDDGAAK